MEAGIDTIKVVTRHSVIREKKSLATAGKRPKRIVCGRCGDRLLRGAEADWVILRTWIVFSEAGETGLGEEEYRCPRCEREVAGSPQGEPLPPALPLGR